MSPLLSHTFQAALPAAVVFGGISMVGKIARENLVPFAAIASIAMFANDCSHMAIDHLFPCKTASRRHIICSIVVSTSIQAIQFLAMRKYGILDNKQSLAFIAFVVTLKASLIARNMVS